MDQKPLKLRSNGPEKFCAKYEKTEATTGGVLLKKEFSNISQISQENTGVDLKSLQLY